MAADIAERAQRTVAPAQDEELQPGDIGRHVAARLRHSRSGPDQLPGPGEDPLAFLDESAGVA